MKRIKISLATKAIILISLLLLAANIALGCILIYQAKESMRTLLQQQMLNTVNSAAAMIDGDAYAGLQAEEKDKPAYRKVFQTFRVFTNQTELKYVYGIRKEADDKFIFTIDPAVENAAPFGETVFVTDALLKAQQGIPAVCEEPYEDSYGRFYTAYSPIRNMEGSVVGLVAADYEAEWFDEQISRKQYTIIISSIFSLLIGALIVLMATQHLRSRFRSLNYEMNQLAADVRQFTRQMTGSSLKRRENGEEGPVSDSESGMEIHSDDELSELGKQIRYMREDLQAHINKVHALAYRDPLTGVKSKQAYAENENELNRKIGEGLVREFAVVACDVNGLKHVNDTYGHQAGDELLRDACWQICEMYKHSPVYRTGGDEFEVLLQGQDFVNRFSLTEAFNKLAEQKLKEGKAVVAVGMADYIPGQDKRLQDVFVRADAQMYERKQELRKMGAIMRD